MQQTRVPLPLLFVSSFTANFGIGLLGFGLLFYLADNFGAGPAQIGGINGAWAFAYLAGCIATRNVTGSIRPWLILPFSTLSMGLSALVILFSANQAFITAAYVFFGFSTSLFWPPLMGWLSSGLEGKALGGALSIFNLSWASGAALAPYAGGLLLTLGGRAPLLAVTILCVLLVLLFSLNLVKNGKHRAQFRAASIEMPKDAEETAPETRGNVLRYAGWVGIFSAYTFTGALLFIFPLYARDQLSMSEPTIGFLLLVKSIATLLGFQYLKTSSWWHYNKRQMLAGQLLLILSGLLFIAVSSPIASAFAMAFSGLLFSLLYTNSIFHGVAGSRNREQRMAVHESVLTAGLILGSVGGGYLYQTYSMDIAFLFCALIAAIGFFCQLMIHRDTVNTKAIG